MFELGNSCLRIGTWVSEMFVVESLNLGLWMGVGMWMSEKSGLESLRMGLRMVPETPEIFGLGSLNMCLMMKSLSGLWKMRWNLKTRTSGLECWNWN